MENMELGRVEAAAAEDPAGLKGPAFDWKNTWYPVSFHQDLAKDRPTGFTLYDEPLVLYFNDAGDIICLKDQCPHRSAPLSAGQIVNGNLECLYHGWQFGAGGRCVHIPQLLEGREMPARSHVRSYPVQVRRGIVWVWAGEATLADPVQIPLTPGADDDANFAVTFQMDLPYDQSYLIENVIDIAHIHVAHHGVRGGGLRQAAKPLEFQIEDSSITGIRSTFRSVGLARAEGSQSLKGASVEFVAPNLIRYVSNYSDPGLVAGLELYSIPLGKNRCRLLYRKYSNFTSAWERRKPRWLEHMTQCLILEQDMAVVVGQAAKIERHEGQLRDMWMPLKSSDQLVIEYRKWLDRFGGTLPFYRGFSTARAATGVAHPGAGHQDRHQLHTQVCGTCGRLYKNLGHAINALWLVVIGAVSIGLIAGNGQVKVGFVAGALAALLAIAAARHLKSRL